MSRAEKIYLAAMIAAGIAAIWFGERPGGAFLTIVMTVFGTLFILVAKDSDGPRDP